MAIQDTRKLHFINFQRKSYTIYFVSYGTKPHNFFRTVIIKGHLDFPAICPMRLPIKWKHWKDRWKIKTSLDNSCSWFKFTIRIFRGTHIFLFNLSHHKPSYLLKEMKHVIKHFCGKFVECSFWVSWIVVLEGCYHQDCQNRFSCRQRIKAVILLRPRILL